MAVKDTDKGYKRIARNMKGIKGHLLTVGVHADAKPYTEGQSEPINQAQIYAVHEFGSRDGKVPERATMRPTVDANREKYQRYLESQLAAIQDGKAPPKMVLGRLGAMVQADIKKAIVDLQTPPLADSTIEAKKRRAGTTLAPGQDIKDVGGEDTGNPLVDTGQMLNSVTWKVEG